MDGDLEEVRVLAAFLACAVQDDFGRVNSLRGTATDAHDRVGTRGEQVLAVLEEGRAARAARAEGVIDCRDDVCLSEGVTG